MENLPNEIWHSIFGYLSSLEIKIASKVCKKWNQILENTYDTSKKHYITVGGECDEAFSSFVQLPYGDEQVDKQLTRIPASLYQHVEKMAEILKICRPSFMRLYGKKYIKTCNCVCNYYYNI